MWFDLYTLSVRVESLGHGIYANKGHEPGFHAGQLADAIVRILCNRPGEEGHSIKMKALEIAKPCRALRGDQRAADVVLAAAQGKSLDSWFH
jgi:hypothetical protein